MKLKHLLVALVLTSFSATAFAKDILITFVCTGNTGRSPMAEALASDMIKKDKLPIKVSSRGVKVDPNEMTPEKGTVTVLKKRGIDISHHQARSLTSRDINQSTYVLTMTEGHKAQILKKYPKSKNKVFTLAEFATSKKEDLSDPYGKPLKAYQKVEKQLIHFLPLALKKASKS